MTTHNSHHEQNDGDASVVANSSAPENASMAQPAASEAAEHTEEKVTPETEASSSSSEAVVDAESSSEQTPAEQSSESTAPDETSEVQHAVAQEEASTLSEAQSAGDADASSLPISTAGDAQQQPQPVAESQQEQAQEQNAPIVEVAEEKQTEVATWNNEPVFTLDPIQALSASSSSSSENTEATGNQPAAEEVSSAETTAESTEVPAANAESEASTGTVEPEVAAATAETSEAATSANESEAGESTEKTKATKEAGVSSLIDLKAEEVRPFTDFIAEFRQAEAALRGTQTETFSILSSEESESIVAESSAESVSSATDAATAESVPASSEAKAEEVTHEEKPAEAAASEKGAQEQGESGESKATSRPVSPLLRPASRLRMPRHGVNRHLREELQQPLPVEEQQGTAANKSEGTVEQTSTQNAQSSSEVPAEQPTPRPARRYRFDRPAASTTHGSSHIHSAAFTTGSHHTLHSPAIRNGQASSQQKREEKLAAATDQAQQVEETKQSAVGQQSNVSSSTANTVQSNQTTESQNKKHANAPEAESNTATQSATEHGNGTGSKRRHNKEKEQQATANQAQESAAVNETAAPAQQNQAEPVAPEDLPPLEYSELQKASSRRRRRHRSSSSPSSSPSPTPAAQTNSASMNGVSVPPSPVTPPVPTPAQVPATPPNRALPTTSNPYSIVSGYTLHQMNQSEGGVSGPFMGPDPSPARGSVLIRDGRTTRAEARPTPTAYPANRSGEGSGISAAAMTQFANVVSGALQQQTDRMVAEFRRMSQSPTNVSVSLPPFPSTERVGVFVDVANLLYSARTLRMTVHFGRLLDFLRGNRRLVRAHAYCPTSPQAGEEQMFLQAVKGLGYRITTKNYKTFSSGAKKADLDLDLCMDVVRLVDGNAVDCIVLVSGDSDFMPMLDYCSDHGVRVEVAAFDEAMSATLRQSCDLFINLSMLEEIRG